MIGLLISSILIIVFVVKFQVSDRICDEATERIIYSDEEFCTDVEASDLEEASTESEYSSAESSIPFDNDTFTKEFVKEDFTDVKTEEDAENLLKRIYAGGGKHK